MLRRIFHIVLSLLLLVATTGLSLHKHYCGEELQKVSMQKVSGCCSMDEVPDNGCCNNETDEHRADTDFQAGHSVQLAAVALLSPDLSAQLLHLLQRSLTPENTLPAYEPSDSGPPPARSLAYLSKLQQFLI